MRVRVHDMTDRSSPPRSDLLVKEPGLTTVEARARLAKYGPNILVPTKRRPTLFIWIVRPLADPMALLLLVAGATYLLLGDYPDAVATLVALVPITLVTLVLEARTERTLEQLRRATAPTAVVWRDGQRQVVPAEDLVPGDLVFLQEGDVIPADGILIQGIQLMVDESALTGESQPVVKDATGNEPERQMYAGAALRSGRGVMRVTATGERTRYGQIGALVAGIREPPTPLQQLIFRLVRQLAVVAVGLCVVVASIQIISGQGWAAGIIAGVSLGIAAIPEEFPMVYTLYLALGAWRLTRKQALIRRLAGVETLGSTTVICSDKTGTLTLGRVEVAALATIQDITRASEPLSPPIRTLVEAAVLASEPHPFDPLEQAILRFATAHGVDAMALHNWTLIHDYPFDPKLKYVAHVWRQNGNTRIAAKGAIEGILNRSNAPDETCRQALAVHRTLASEGMRVLAVASGEVPQPTGNRAEDERHLRFVGLVAFSDPLRPGVTDALRACREAGIRVIMITGDHPLTAHAVAEELGLPHDETHALSTGDELDAADDQELAKLVRKVNIFARTRPEQRYRIVRALRAQGEVVATMSPDAPMCQVRHRSD
jgi:Ca2+-transporting ATPase